MTAFVTSCPKYSFASVISFRITCAEISSGLKSLFNDEHLILMFPLLSLITLYGNSFDSSETSSALQPINRLTEKNVFSALTTDWRLASWPTNNSSFFV